MPHETAEDASGPVIERDRLLLVTAAEHHTCDDCVRRRSHLYNKLHFHPIPEWLRCCRRVDKRPSKRNENERGNEQSHRATVSGVIRAATVFPGMSRPTR
jgi:hypothetical protein